jgi:very-short-patch-repair endonuclease
MARAYRPPARLWERERPVVRQMRTNPTSAEEMLWTRLRDRRLAGHKFRRQHPIGRFIVDYCCPARHIVVEVDGGIHRNSAARDMERDEHLRLIGFQVLRFSNERIVADMESVLGEIERALTSELPTSPRTQ